MDNILNDLGQRLSNFFELGTPFKIENSSADHLTLVPFEGRCAGKNIVKNTTFIVFYISLLLLKVEGKSVDGWGNKFHKISVVGEKRKAIAMCHFQTLRFPAVV